MKLEVIVEIRYLTLGNLILLSPSKKKVNVEVEEESLKNLKQIIV
jgi:hypothetical protein